MPTNIIEQLPNTAPSRLQIPTADDMKKLVASYLKTHKTSYVHVAVVTKTASALVFVVCLVSLAISVLTGYKPIQPIFAVVLVVWSAVFYAMGRILAKQTGDDSRRI